MSQEQNHKNNIDALIALVGLESHPLEALKKIALCNQAELVQEAQRQGVAPWVYHKLSEMGSDAPLSVSLRSALKSSLLYTYATNESNLRILEEIEDILGRNSIDVGLLKGISLIISLYSDPSLRPTGDLDLFVSAADVFRARDILVSKGADPGVPPLSPLHEMSHAHVRSITFKGRLVELHQRFYDVGNKFNLTVGIEDSFEEFEFRGKKHLKLNDTLLAYHLITHLAYNIKMGGCRLGWFVDIALLFSRHGSHADLLYNKVVGLNSAANDSINNVLSMSSELMTNHAANSLTANCGIKQTPLPPNLLAEPKNISGGHKFLVVKHILGHPGFKNKFTLLFREFFPTREYMEFFHPQYRGRSLFGAYFKRLFNVLK